MLCFKGAAATVVLLILTNPSLGLLSVADKIEWVFYIFFPNFCLGKGVQDIYVNYQNAKTCDNPVPCALFKARNLTHPCCFGKLQGTLICYLPDIIKKNSILLKSGCFNR